MNRLWREERQKARRESGPRKENFKLVRKGHSIFSGECFNLFTASSSTRSYRLRQLRLDSECEHDQLFPSASQRCRVDYLTFFETCYNDESARRNFGGETPGDIDEEGRIEGTREEGEGTRTSGGGNDSQQGTSAYRRFRNLSCS